MKTQSPKTKQFFFVIDKRKHSLMIQRAIKIHQLENCQRHKQCNIPFAIYTANCCALVTLIDDQKVPKQNGPIAISTTN